MKKCLACGSDNLSDGELVSTGAHLLVHGTPIDFKSKEGKTTLTIFGTACLNCGHIQMTIDHNVLQQRINK